MTIVEVTDISEFIKFDLFGIELVAFTILFCRSGVKLKEEISRVLTSIEINF
jgi:hypothetical protein